MFRPLYYCLLSIVIILLTGCTPDTSKNYLRLPYQGRSEYAPPGISLAKKAQIFQTMLDRDHISPEGLLIYRRDMLRSEKVGFSHESLADGPIWGGAHLAAESFRYAKTRSSASLAAVRRTVKALHLLQAVHGIRGLLVRQVRPKNDPVPIESHVEHYDGIGAYSHLEYRADVSKDQYSGMVFGYGVAWELVDDDEVRLQIREDITAIADFLMRNDYIIIDVDGKPTKYSNVRGKIGPLPIGVHALISLCAIRTAWRASGEEKYRLEYERLLKKGWHKATWLVKFQFLGQTNHNNDNMGFIASYPLLMTEDRPEIRRYYTRSIERTWKHVRHEGNSLFAFIYLGTGGSDPVSQDDAILQMKNFPLSKRRFPMDNLGRPDVETGFFKNRKGEIKAKYPLPINMRHQTSFTWKDDPYRLKWPGSETGHLQYAPVDYLLAYWMGRYHGFIGEDD